MSSPLTGKDILNALIELKGHANLNEIVEHLSAKNKGSKTALLAAAEVILDVGVDFGYIVEDQEGYRTEYIIPKDEQQIEPNEDEEKAHHVAHRKTNRKLYSTTEVSSDDNEDEPNDDCDSGFSRRRRYRSRSGSKRRNSRRRRRHG